MIWKTKFLILAICLSSFFSLGQENYNYKIPDYKAIEIEVSNKESNLYYPKLLKRFQQNDTTLSQIEIKHLYYGRFYSPSPYKPFLRSKHQDSAILLMQKSNMMNSDKIQLVKHLENTLLEMPLDIRTLAELRFAYQDINDNRSEIFKQKVNSFLDVIIETGNGKTAKSAWHIATVDDEYTLIGLLGLEYGGSQALVDGPCDYLKIASNKYNIDGIYFNVEQLMKAEQKSLQKH